MILNVVSIFDLSRRADYFCGSPCIFSSKGSHCIADIPDIANGLFFCFWACFRALAAAFLGLAQTQANALALAINSQNLRLHRIAYLDGLQWLGYGNISNLADVD